MITSLPPRSPVTPQSVATIRLKEDQRLKRKAEFISNFNIAHGGGSGVAREGEGENENIELGVNHGAVGGSNSILYLDDDVATTNSRGIVILSPWRKYWFEVKQMFTKTYWINYYRDWRDLVHSSSSNGAAASAGEERLVDSQILSWSYLEGGLIECLGAMVTFVAVLHFEFGVEWIDCVRMQRGGKEYFRPSSPDYILSNGETIVSY